MSQGNDGPYGGPGIPYGQLGHPTQHGYQMPLGQQQASPYQTSYDPVTGQQLPPGPPAYSAVDPSAQQPYPPQLYAQQPGYPSQPYASQPGYPGYPPAGYQFAPMYPVVAVRPPTPGGAIAAAVLAFVQAGFVLIGSVFMFTGAGLDQGSGSDRYSSEFAVTGAILLIVGGLLIAGGTTMLNRRSMLLALGGLLSIALSVYFVIRFADFAFGVAVWVPIIYAVLPVVAIALSRGSDVRSWVRSAAYVQ